MKKLILAVLTACSALFACVPAPALANTPGASEALIAPKGSVEWTVISSGKSEMQMAINAESIAYGKAEDGAMVIVVDARILYKSQATFESWYIKLDQCAAGSGQMVTTDIMGKFKSSHDFYIGGGNLVSSIAGALCEVHALIQAEAKANGKAKAAVSRNTI